MDKEQMFWVDEGGKAVGPFPLSALKEDVRHGRRVSSSRVCLIDSDKWLTIGDLMASPSAVASGCMYAVSDKQLGPVAQDELVKLFVDGKISSDTQVLLPGQTTWQTLDQSGLLRSSGVALPPLTEIQRREGSMFAPVYRILDYKGRSTRSEFAKFLLITFCGSILAVLPGGLIDKAESNEALSIVVVALMVLWALFVFAIAIPISVRRLHDFGYSGWWIFPVALFNVIPVIGSFIQLGIYLLPAGDSGTNRFGPNPRRSYVAEKLSNRI